MSEDQAPGLFGVDELAGHYGRMGPVEAALHRAVAAGEAAGSLVPEDAALAAAALAAARSLDAATAGGALGGRAAYAVAALLTPYREVLHALRLPVALAPGDVLAGGKASTADGMNLGDLFGSSDT